jgi:hypothetical protein
MPYQFTCPLCLVTLGQRHWLRLFKIGEAGSDPNEVEDRIDCGDPDFINNILKFSGDDVFVPTDEYAVYVSHEKCTAANPFWKDDKLEIPGTDSDGERFLATLASDEIAKGFQANLSYWMVKILRETYKLGDDYRPMWYPLQLLLATAKEVKHKTRPYGSLVEMASSKSVGKTILTLQILNQELYRNGREVTVRDFFYPNADLADVGLGKFREKFYSEVFYHSMWKSTPVSRPFGTVPSAGDLRAIFIQPVAGEYQPPKADRRANGRVKRSAASAYGMAMDFARDFFMIKPKEQKERESGLTFEELVRNRKDEYWSPIIFYDTAGELQETMGMATRSVRELTDKLAICVDAREIFDRYEPLMPEEKLTPVNERNASIRHACRRLKEREHAPRRRKSTCIIVTKLDLVLSDEEKQQVKDIAEAENANADEAARDLLIKWLAKYPDPDKQNLRARITRERGLVEKVFFVWTENLPRMKGVRRSPISKIEPGSAYPGEEVTLIAEQGFNFEDAKKVTFNGVESSYEIDSKEKIRATVPATATSGLVGIVLEGIPTGVAPTSNTYKDDATSNVPFTVLPKVNSDPSRPRSYGINRFLAWCLDKEIDEISRPTAISIDT